MKPRVPAQEKKASKPLVVKFRGGCGGGRNSQSYRRICWRGPCYTRGPRTYTSPPIQESAPGQYQKGHKSLVGSGGGD